MHSTLRKQRRLYKQDAFEKLTDEFQPQIIELENSTLRLQKEQQLVKELMSLLSGSKKSEVHRSQIEDMLYRIDHRFYRYGVNSHSWLKVTPQIEKERLFENYIRYDQLIQTLNPEATFLLDDAPGQRIRTLLVNLYCIRYPQARLTKFFHSVRKNQFHAQGLFDGLDLVGSLTDAKNAIIKFFSSLRDRITGYFAGIVKEFTVTLMLAIVGIAILVPLVANSILDFVIKLWAFWSVKGQSDQLNSQIETYQKLDQEKIFTCQGGPRVISALQGVGTAISTFFDKVDKFEPIEFINRFGVFAARWNSCEAFCLRIWSHLQVMTDFIFEKITGEPYFEVTKTLHNCRVEMARLAQYQNEYASNKSTLTNARAKEINDMIMKYTKLFAVNRTRIQPVVDCVTQHQLSCNDVVEASKIRCNGGQLRAVPLWIHVIGEPGVGKTRLISELAVCLYKMANGILPDVDSVVYSRCRTDQYWSGYAHQYCVLWDEFLQATDQETRRQECLEMLQLCTSAPYSLNMASLSEKGTFFKSGLIVTTSNIASQHLPTNLGIMDSNALYRRMDIKLIVKKGDVEGDSVLQTAKFDLFRPVDNQIQKTAISGGELLALCDLHMKTKLHNLQRTLLSHTNIDDAIKESYKSDLKRIAELIRMAPVQEQKSLLKEFDPNGMIAHASRGNNWMKLLTQDMLKSFPKKKVHYEEDEYMVLTTTPTVETASDSSFDEDDYALSLDSVTVTNEDGKVTLTTETEPSLVTSENTPLIPSAETIALTKEILKDVIVESSYYDHVLQRQLKCRQGDEKMLEYESKKKFEKLAYDLSEVPIEIPSKRHIELFGPFPFWYVVLLQEQREVMLQAIQYGTKPPRTFKIFVNFHRCCAPWYMDLNFMTDTNVKAAVQTAYIHWNKCKDMMLALQYFEDSPTVDVTGCLTVFEDPERHKISTAPQIHKVKYEQSLLEVQVPISLVSFHLADFEEIKTVHGWLSIYADSTPDKLFEHHTWVSQKLDYKLLRVAQAMWYMSRGELPMLISPCLDTIAFRYGFRVLTKKGTWPEPILYFADYPDNSRKMLAPWINQAVYGWTDLGVLAFDTGHNAMIKISRKPSSMYEGFKNWIGRSHPVWERTEVHSVRKRLGFLENLDHEIEVLTTARTKRYNRMCETMALLSIAIVAACSVAAIVFIVKSIVEALAYNPKMMAQSWDESHDKRQRRHQKKRPKTKVVVRSAKGAQKMPKTVFQTQMMEAQTTSVAPIVPKVVNNVEMVTFIGESSMSCFVLFVNADTFVTTAHQFRADHITSLKFHWTHNESVGCVTVTDFKLKFLDNRDAVLVQVRHSGLPMYKDLSKHLLSRADYAELKEISHIVKVDFSENGQVLLSQTDKAMLYKNGKETSVHLDNSMYVCDNWWIVPGQMSDPGDCGLPYLTSNTKFQKRLLGIHSAGSPRDGSLFVPVYAEDVKPSEFSTQGLSTKFVWPNYDEFTFVLDTSFEYAGLRSVCRILRNDKPHVSYSPNKTKIVSSDLPDQIGEVKKPFEVTTAPVLLRNCVFEGERIKPFDNAVARFAVPTRNDIGLAIPHKSKHFDGIFSGVDLTVLRPLTEKEVVNGVKGSKFLGPVDLSASSSIGFSDQGLGMDQVIQGPDGEREFTPKFRAIMDRFEKKLDQKKTVPYVCTGTLKDETKNVKKINKPRIFANGSKSMLCLAKKYFGDLFERILDHNGERDVYIGINCLGHQWRKLAAKMASKSVRKLITDDIAGWDLHMRLIFCSRLREDMLKRGCPKDMADKMFLIALSCLSPYVVLGDKVYRYLGMPSGSYLTAVFNSMYNSWMQRCLFDIELGDKYEFDEVIAQATFGDDLAQAVSDLLDDELWNGQLLADLRKKYFNVETTSIFKDGGAIPKFLPLYQTGNGPSAQFLRREFVLRDGEVYPCLNLESINSMVSWIRPDAKRTKDICIRDNVETALRELALYDANTFTTYEIYFRKYYGLRGWKFPGVVRSQQLHDYFSS